MNGFAGRTVRQNRVRLCCRVAIGRLVKCRADVLNQWLCHMADQFECNACDDKQPGTMAEQIARAVCDFQQKSTGHTPKAVSAVLSEDTLVRHFVRNCLRQRSTVDNCLETNLHQSFWIPPNTASPRASMYASVIRTSVPE
jgi:hypothetical protein